MTISRLLLIATLVLLPLAQSRAQDTPALRHGPVFGTFSDLRYSNETGDVNGTEITIVPQYRSAYVIFQCADGAPTDPVFVSAQIKGGQVTFKIEGADSCAGEYLRLVTLRGMTLSVRKSDFNGNGFLPRRKSYWAR